MLNIHARARVAVVLDPIGAALARTSLSPDLVTTVGTVGVLLGSVLLYAWRGQLFWGSVVVAISVLADMLDGALARARGTASRWGAFLDSSLDRVADAAIFGSLAWWFAFGSGAGAPSRALVLACLLCLVLGAVTSYVKARAEGLGMTCNVGFAERSERLIIVLIGTGLSGLGIPYIQAVALWALVIASVITVGQRVATVRRQSAVAPPVVVPGPEAEPDAEPGRTTL